jgi:hypothetical protein
MADTGLTNPGTAADDATVGTITWANTSNALTDNTSYASANVGTLGDSYVLDYSIRLVKGGTIVGSDYATASDWTTTENTVTYGGATDLWGTTWTASDINDSTFGVVLSCQSDIGIISHYLKTTNYGFALGGSDTIDGIEVSVQHYWSTAAPLCFTAGTLIACEMGDFPIEELEVGDKVYSFNDKLEVELDRVVGTLSREVDHYYRIMAGGREVEATGNHEFLTLDGFRKVEDLKVGTLVYNGAWVSVESIERVDEITTVYDLSVEKNHTFIANGFFVHNIIIISNRFGNVDVIQVKIYYTAGTTNTGFMPLLM